MTEKKPLTAHAHATYSSGWSRQAATRAEPERHEHAEAQAERREHGERDDDAHRERLGRAARSISGSRPNW